MKRNVIIVLLGLVALLAATSPATAADPDNSGYLYGTVETSSGNSYTGLLRWGTEEAFWDDLFNSSKEKLPYIEKFQSDRRKRDRIKVFGITIGYRWDDSTSSRMYIARFGDIKQIRTGRGDRIKVTMKDDYVYDLDGGSNDIGATVTVVDESLGRVRLEWKKIEKITFKSTPSSVKPEGYRLFGKVTTDDETFEGFIQWDSQECLSTDKLDGDSEDGDLSIDMGRIRAIEKHNRNGSWVTLKDDRKILLEDTNDVDDSLRGIFVEDERYGRVKVSWKAFERIEFSEVARSGRGYDDYPPGKKLSGRIIDYDGGSHSGHMVFDLDETFSWELLNGDLNNVEYYIPFDLIRSIEPQRGDQSLVRLQDSVERLLGDGQDVSESNDGVVVIRDNDRETYLRWDEIKRIDFK